MDLDGLEQPLARVAPLAHRVEDEQHVLAVGVELRPLAELDRVLDRDRVQAERLAERLDLLGARVGEVEPEELVALAQLGEAVAVDALENLHLARAYPRGGSVRPVTLPVGAYKLEGISPRAYQHPADRAATAALGQVPYLDQVVRKLIELGYERALRAVSLGSSVRLGQEQLPHIWVLHRQVVNSLDLAAVPDLYLTQFPMANAMTIGVGKPIVVLNSELVTLLDADGQRAVLAHEAAHVHSDHVLYQTALLILLRLSANLPILAGLPLIPIRYALLEWFRAAELSCDRAAALLTRDPQAVCRTLMVLSAGAAAEQLNLDAFIKQGMDYSESGTGVERLSRLFQDLQVTHPLPVKRVRELLDWVREGDYDRIVGGDYMKRGEEPPLREEGEGAAAHYGERVKGAFEKAGTSVSDVGEQLSGWLEKLKRAAERPPPAGASSVPRRVASFSK